MIKILLYHIKKKYIRYKKKFNKSKDIVKKNNSLEDLIKSRSYLEYNSNKRYMKRYKDLSYDLIESIDNRINEIGKLNYGFRFMRYEIDKKQKIDKRIYNINKILYEYKKNSNDKTRVSSLIDMEYVMEYLNEDYYINNNINSRRLRNEVMKTKRRLNAEIKKQYFLVNYFRIKKNIINKINNIYERNKRNYFRYAVHIP